VTGHAQLGCAGAGGDPAAPTGLANCERGLAFDIGANTGQDTVALLARGLRVVAVEANPKLCADMRKRFAAEIGAGRLVIIDRAISGRKTVTLYVNTADSGWGTTMPDYAARGMALAGDLKEIEVETITVPEIIRAHGVPDYLKVDIEGADILCLLGLFDVDGAPRFISIERPSSIPKQRFAFELLRRLGYTRFQIIDQTKVPEQRHRTLAFQRGDTGLFGSELPKADWMGFSRSWLLNCWIVFRSGIMRRIPGIRRFAVKGRWFDIHASIQ
jgi:FkbM family methyltransferase